MHLTFVDEASAAALAHFLGDRDYAVYSAGSRALDVNPLGSVNVELLVPQLATHLKQWLTERPGMVVRLDST
jgi:hypothetical protein